MGFEKRAGENIILIIEDNPDDIFFIKRALLRAGVENPVYFLKNGEEAINYLSGKGKYGNRKEYPLPVIMLIDLKLPRVSGFELLRWIRSMEDPISLIPVVVFTTSSQPSDINKAYELGANSYIVKPFSMEALTGVFKRVELYWVTMNRPAKNFQEVKGNENKGSEDFTDR